MAWGILIVAAVAVAPLPLRAQEADPPPAETGTVGPRELENFSINGTVTQPAPQRPAPATNRPAPATQAPPTATRPATQPADRPSASGPAASEPNRPDQASEQDRVRRESEPLRQSAPSSSVTAALPGLDSQAEAPASAVEDAAVPSATTGGGLLLWPWLLAALAAAAGLAFYVYRGRLQPSYAGGPEVQAFEAPRPASRKVAPRHDPTPRAIPAPTPPAEDDPFKGLVSTRLRPWIELGFHASRCTVEDDKVTIEFEIEMSNSGNAPARAVLVEARLVNAGPAQDSEIDQFFSNPVGKGERIDTIAPLKNVRIKSRIVTPRENVQVYDVGGRKVFVPLIAFNILYGWSRGNGQTSASYLVGRDTKSDKMAPFRLDLGPRLFRSLAQTPLPIVVRQ
ncbi:MAG: hypothetical protein ABIS39_01320 [Sphingomicrobium sp.]